MDGKIKQKGKMMIELKFHSPALLNTLGSTATEEPKIWTVFIDDGQQQKAMFDLEAMSILAEEDQLNYKFLKELFIKEEENQFFFEQVDDAKELDFPFAASMLGQILSGQELIDALRRLDEHYNEMQHDESSDDETKLEKEI